jgi:hypothetical protein
VILLGRGGVLLFGIAVLVVVLDVVLAGAVLVLVVDFVVVIVGRWNDAADAPTIITVDNGISPRS